MQTLTPFGVGAIVDMLGESFVAEDITRWKGRFDTIPAARIAADFGAVELRTPPDLANKSGLPYFRFPQWLFCGSCRSMTQWSISREKSGRPPRCDNCNRSPQLVPMRFVAVCGNGHLDDVPWPTWAHSGVKVGREQRQCGIARLKFLHVNSVGGGLESLRIRCSTCKAERDLANLTSPQALSRLNLQCCGRQPWQNDNEAVACDQPPVVLQRGASSVYFPSVGSAIDLPPDSDWTTWSEDAVRIEQNPYFLTLLKRPDGPLSENLIEVIADENGVTTAQVRAVLDDRLGMAAASSDPPGDLIEREWLALTNPRSTHDHRDRFISQRVPFPAPAGHGALQPVVDQLVRRISDVVMVSRLREIRVLRGFRRHTMDSYIPADLGKRTGVLPAIEIFGEGVFVRFNDAALQKWEYKRPVLQRVSELRRRLAGSMHARWIEAEPMPRLVLLHTIAHLLMRQLAFDAGYPSSSLRERVYASLPGAQIPMAGILIYTAAGDSEGTLGGLARSGEAVRLAVTITSALASAQWCSLDPVCSESTAQGPDGLSMAACHACTLAAETSCTLGNVLLDRNLVIHDEYGFMMEPLAELISVRAGTK
ncbi:DrmB family protein [Micromonospora sp. LOL_021]|uniref:DrmB family protein n=1 Tax=Micromonospora sp. LOL_021 TaxID=3345417 RepID=UPI003A8B9FC0